MKKLFLLILMLLLTVPVIKAQNSYQEVVYLKNGGIIRGVIIETRPNELIKIQTSDMSVFVYKMEEVDRITKEAPISQYSNQSRLLYNQPRGYYGVFQIGGGGTVADYYTPNGIINFSIINGYRANHHFAIGGGIGLDFIVAGPAYTLGIGIPLFLDLRGNILKSKISPYWSLQIGPEFFTKGGITSYISPTIGLKIGLPSGNLHLGLSYIYSGLHILSAKVSIELGSVGLYNKRVKSSALKTNPSQKVMAPVDRPKQIGSGSQVEFLKQIKVGSQVEFVDDGVSLTGEVIVIDYANYSVNIRCTKEGEEKVISSVPIRTLNVVK